MQLRFPAYVSADTSNPRPRRRAAALAGLAVGALLAACQSPPRVDLDAEGEISRAAQLGDTLEFRSVGPNGGPLDEGDAAPARLTLAEAVRRAVSTDAGLQASLARVRLFAANADQARLLPNPVLGIVYRAGQGSPQFEASFAQEFIQALQRPSRASAADNRLRSVVADAVATALDVISDVQDRYIESQASAALLPLLEERLALVEKLVTTSQARLDAGEGTRSDVVTLEGQRVEVQVAINRARADARSSRLRLARLIGTPSSDAAWELDAWTAPTLRRRAESEWMAAALGARPELQAIEWRLRALGDEAQMQSLAPWEGASVGLDAQSADGWQAGPALSVPLPLFDNGDAKRAANWAEQLEARHELTRARRVVIEEVRVAYQGLAANVANLQRIESELIPLQRLRRELAEDAYRAGQTDVTPLFLAEQDLRVAQTQAIEVEAQAASALVRLQRAVGGPDAAERVADAAPHSQVPALAADSTSTTKETP